MKLFHFKKLKLSPNSIVKYLTLIIILLVTLIWSSCRAYEVPLSDRTEHLFGMIYLITIPVFTYTTIRSLLLRMPKVKDGQIVSPKKEKKQKDDDEEYPWIT